MEKENGTSSVMDLFKGLFGGRGQSKDGVASETVPEPETEADEVPAADEDAEPDETASEEGENASGEAETAEGEKKERPEKPEGFDPSNLPERPENGEKPNN